jgi:hypothetical protein
MKLDNYKNIKKTEWQVIANNFGIKYEENSVVRYLVEKIAEKIGVDDKIVSDNELKKQVVDKINSDFEIVPIDEVTTEPTKKATAKKTPVKKDVKPKSPVIGKVGGKKEVKNITTEDSIVKEEPKTEVVEEKPAVIEIPVVELSRLEQLRLECESYGISWSEAHTEQNLEQVLNGVKSAGVQPIKEMPKTITKSNENIALPSLDTNAPFEINSSNANQVAQAVANTPKGDPAYNPLAIPPAPIVNGGYQNSNAYLDTYKNIYLNTIRGHWRVLSVAEINEMILRDTQTFKHQVNINPQQQNKAEIILTDGSYSIRIPSDNTNEWLDING